jgi:glycosyltransferase involved in cell wall biosynthesis
MIYIDVSDACKSPMQTGTQRVTRRIYRELARRGPITPICWNDIRQQYHSLGAEQFDLLERPFVVRPQRSAKPQRHGDTLAAEARRAAFRKRLSLETDLSTADVLLVPDLYRGARASFLPRLLRKTSSRSVAIFHDAAALRLGLLGLRGPARFRRYLDSLAAFDLVVCISKEARADLLRFWEESRTTPTRTLVEPWPVEFAESTRPSVNRSGRRIVLSVGTLETRKNHLLLLEAAEALWEEGCDFELQLIGRSARGYGERVVRQVRRLRARGRRVRWLQHVNDDELQRAYHGCSFTVYPSLMEGFGLPILESLWHGKPCICGDNGALGEAAAEGGCLVVDQTKPASIAAGMRRLLSDPTKYSSLCEEAGRRTFRTWADYISKLQSHLDSLG